MAKYAIVYLGGDKPASKEEGMAHRQKYKAWLSALGDACVSPANPLVKMHTIRADGVVVEGGQSTMSGYTIIQADSIDAAVEMAKQCPFLDINGTLEVSELMQMPM